MLRASLEALRCSDSIDGDEYLLADYSVTCWVGSHVTAATFAILSLVGFSIGAPLAALLYLRRYRDRLQTEWLQRRMAFL